MDRDLLAGLLEREGEAFAACRHAVLSGARFWMDDLPYPASALVKTYARRDRSTQKRGIATARVRRRGGRTARPERARSADRRNGRE
jgi:hypothetical protein